jgi:hypothetical protein
VVILRWMRICVVGALTAAIALTVVAGTSFASHASGQIGYGGTQVLGEQFIKPKSGGSGVGIWVGVIVALGIIVVAITVGRYRMYYAIGGTDAGAAAGEFVGDVRPFVNDEGKLASLGQWFRRITAPFFHHKP